MGRKNLGRRGEGERIDLDLFGQPVVPMRDPRGRPSFRKSKENQETVATLAAAGWTAERIGPYLGCDPQTVRKHFSRELQYGAAFVEGMALQVLVARMKEGHAPSARAVLEITRAKAAVRGSVIGKKEARKAAAHQAPAEWGDLLGEGGPVN